MTSMRTSFLACGLWLLWAPAGIAQDVSIRRVTSHVITLSMSNLGTHTNVTVIETKKGLVVVETEITPYIMNRIKEAAEKELGRSDWAYVINTHGHLHHAGGNCVFQGAQVVGHETMNVDWLRRRLSTETGRRQYCRDVGVDIAIAGLRQILAKGAVTPAQRQELRRRLDFCLAVEKEIMAGFEVVGPTITFADRYAMDLGDVHLRLVYWGDAINHSSIFVHVVEDHLLVGMGMAGDWLPDFYGKASLDSIRRAISIWRELADKDLRIDQMIGVHSPNPVTSRLHFQHRAEYLQALLNDLTKARQQGLSQQQAKDTLSIDKRYAFVRKYFTQPQNLDERHQSNIDTIWALLQHETPSASPN